MKSVRYEIRKMKYQNVSIEQTYRKKRNQNHHKMTGKHQQTVLQPTHSQQIPQLQPLTELC